MNDLTREIGNIYDFEISKYEPEEKVYYGQQTHIFKISVLLF